jgi:O-antigen/teichoic acid export membrane protein
MPIIKKVLSSFKNIHLLSLFGTGFNALVGMVVFALTYRALSKDDLGAYIIFMLILNLIDTLKSGLLTGAFVKFFSGANKARANEVAGSAWSLAALITGILIIINMVTYFFADYASNHAVILVFKCFAIASLSTLPSFMANLAVQGERRFDRLIGINLMNQGIFMIFVILLMVLHKATLTHIIISYICANTIASIATLLLRWTKIRTIRYTTKKTFWEIFHFGKYSFGSSISTNLFRVTDTFFLSYFLGSSAVAIYNLGGKLNQIVEIPLLSLATSGSPVLAGHYNNDEKDKMMFVMKKMVGMLTLPLIALAILSIIFAEPVIAILGGKDYINTQAPNLFRIFMCFSILAPTDRFFALTLDTIHKPQINFYKILVMLTINLIADYVGVILFKSPYAIALTNVLSLLAAIIISYVPLNKYYKFNFWDTYLIGYHELILFIKQTYNSLFEKEKATGN